MQRPAGRSLFAVLVLLGAGTSGRRASAQTAASVSPATPVIAVSATGQAKLTPDRATIYVGVQSRAASAAAAARDNAQRQNAVIGAVVALGISRQQISTENYSVNPETRFDQGTQKSVVTGYVVSNVVRIEIERLDQVAPVIDAALAKGANQINSLDFFASNSDDARHRALADAVGSARGDAEAMARAAGGSIGALLELSTTESGPRPVFRSVASASIAGPTPTPIEPGQETVQVIITARWQFVPQR